MSKEIYQARKDPEYQAPFIDCDEMRERTFPDGKTLPYRYMHGGFSGTGLKFSFCFPEKEAFRGSFFQYLSPFPGPNEEMVSLGKHGEDDEALFALSHGAGFIETNMASAASFGPSQNPETVWKSSAAAAEFYRDKAMEIYGCTRPYGVVYGGSGGGYKTMACIENTSAWDGAVPFVIGSPVSLPNTIMLHAQGQRALRHCFSKIIDKVDAGGDSSRLYEDLTADEAAMLREITLMGFSPTIWYSEASGRIDDGSLPVLMPLVQAQDPAYFTDFWTLPGYFGSDPESSAAKDRLQFTTVVKSVHTPETEAHQEAMNDVDGAWKKQLSDGTGFWIETEAVPQGEDLYLKGVNIRFETGEARGATLLLDRIVGNRLLIGMCFGMDDLPGTFAKVREGDVLSLNNSDYIAVQSYYRHQVPNDPAFHAWDQFRDAEGKPTVPQRPRILGLNMTGTGRVQDGEIQGPVIVVQSLNDESTCPWCADWYRNKVREAKGSEENFRLYYNDHCMHGNTAALKNTMVTNYMAILHQAILDMADWVEQGKEPLPSTVYQVNGGEISVPEDAGSRGGLQPVGKLLANDSQCAHVKCGEEVHFVLKVEVPRGAGSVTGVRYGFTEDWSLPPKSDPYPVEGSFTATYENGLHGAVSEITRVYDEPGTYFAVAYFTSSRDGKADDMFTQCSNLARVRIIVEA